VAGERASFTGDVYNVVDDELVDAKAFLQRYRREIRKMPYVTVPYALTRLLSLAVEKYSERSGGQLPAIFTPYKSASMWKGNRFDNGKLRALGWKPVISTEEGLRRHFATLR